MNKYILGFAAVCIVIAASLVFYGMGNKAPESSDKLKVTASFYPVYYFASEIGGDLAEVRNITPVGADPHDYEPAPQDIAAIYESDLFVVNGAGFEAWAERVIGGLPESVVVVEAGESLATLEGVEDEHEEGVHEEEEEGHGLYDPHVWLSPALTTSMVDAILAGFLAADSANASYYESRANALKQELAQLEDEFRTGLSACAKDNFVTSHAAFGYIARDYNLQQLAITGLAHEAEPSARQLAEITEFARANNVTHIFFETLISPKLAETIAREVGAQTLVLNPLEGLTQEEVGQGKTYISEMRANLANLKVALQCN